MKKSSTFTLTLTILLFCFHGFCKSDIGLGYTLTLPAPVEYIQGFIGKAYLVQTQEMEPNFKAAMVIEAVEGKYSCSLQVFLGDVKVWNSGHYSRFYISDKCVLELTKDGDLRLKGPKKHVGWRTGTHKQGVERLQIENTGNLVLLDDMNKIKWQSFNFPTDTMLRGQILDVATRLTSFRNNSSLFYSFEVEHDKISLYVNLGKLKYSYWEYKPLDNRSINFVKVATNGLEIFDDDSQKVAKIESEQTWPMRFLALGNRTGNLGLYFFSSEKGKFETSFEALNTTCDLPLACKPYGICTFSDSCSCIRVQTKQNQLSSDCGVGIFEEQDLCHYTDEAEIVELNGVTTVLKDGIEMGNVSKETCTRLCRNDCKCAAALYYSGKKKMDMFRGCSLYGVVMGVKQVERETGLSYMVKIPKGRRVRKSGIRKWILTLVGGVDGLIIVFVIAGIAYYVIRRRKNSLDSDADS